MAFEKKLFIDFSGFDSTIKNPIIWIWSEKNIVDPGLVGGDEK